MKLLSNLKIGSKLSIGFGLLVFLTLVVIGLSYLGSLRATTYINRTSDLSAPTALASARAQASLLRMLADVRGYLALGEESYRKGYTEARGAFETNLATLETLSHQADPTSLTATIPQNSIRRLETLKAHFADWSRLPMRLFTLHDDQLEREPGLQMLIEKGNRPIALIVVSIKKIIETQRRREPTVENMALLGDIASFQASFFAMVSGLRGYVTTARNNFKFEYTTNLTINDRALERLVAKEANLSGSQQKRLKMITNVRGSFLPLPGKMFDWVEGPRRRMDLFLFRKDAIPLAKQMLKLLDEMAADQQNLLQTDLTEGRDRLMATQWQILIGGIVALFVGLALAAMFRENIAGPVRRLTRVTEQIGTGDLTARATVESGDEIGKLARTFNKMSAKLEETLEDLNRRRKKQKKIAKTLHRQNVYLGALHDTTLGLIRRLDITELLSDLITRAGHLLDTPHGYIYLVDPTALALERHLGVGAFSNTIGHHMGPNEGVAGKVWQTGEPLVVNEYNSWPERMKSAEYEVTISAIMGVPLTSGPDVIGVLGMAYDIASDKRFGQDEVELLSRFGELASISLDNARLYTATQEAKRQTDKELREAANYVKQMLPAPLNDGPVRIDWRFEPSASLGGDSFGYQWIDDDNLAVYLLDVSGHGVGAALLSVSILNALRSQTLSETEFKNPGDVLSALNGAFPGEKHNDMFFTIWYGVYTKSTRTLNYASGGHPPALLFSASKKQRFEMIPLRTKNNVIGAMPNATYHSKKRFIHANSNLFIFSDGVYEHRKTDGSMWRLDEFSDFMFNLSTKSRSRLQRLHSYAKDLCVEKNFQDDFTILEVAFG
jgi:serine phosphatase RsbU (regulator of sigma subunit)/CHASE3 domain sensor protein